MTGEVSTILLRSALRGAFSASPRGWIACRSLRRLVSLREEAWIVRQITASAPASAAKKGRPPVSPRGSVARPGKSGRMNVQDVVTAAPPASAIPPLEGPAAPGGKRKIDSVHSDPSDALNSATAPKKKAEGASKPENLQGGAAKSVLPAGIDVGKLEKMFSGEESPEPGSAEQKIIKKYNKIQDPAEKSRFKYRSLLSRVHKEDDVEAAERLFEESRESGPLDGSMYNLLLSMMSTHNRTDIIHKLHDDMKQIGLPNNEAAYATVMRCFANEDRPEEAEALLDNMMKSGIKTKIRSFDAILHSYCRLVKVDQAYSIYERMKGEGLEATDSEYAALVRLFTAIDKDDDARFDVVLQDMKENLLELSSEALDALAEYYGRKKNALLSRQAKVMPETGLCTSCGDVLASIDLSPEAVKALMDKLDAIVREDALRIPRWEEFLRTIESRKFDVILDGANIGYYNSSQGGNPQHVNYNQIAWVAEHLQEEGYHPLVVLQYRHVRYEWTPEEYHALINKWKAENILLVPPLKNNDDWYWMYAALIKGGKVAVITNDEMRDHTFQMLAQRDFKRWKDRHLARFYMEGNASGKRRRKIHIIWPTAYSRCIQETPSGWHFPQAISIAEGEEEDEEGKGNDEETEGPWLCVRTHLDATDKAAGQDAP